MDRMEPQQTMLAGIVDAANRLVNPIMAYAFTGAIIYSAIADRPLDQTLIGIAGLVIGSFIQKRENDKERAIQEKQQSQIVELAKAVPPPAQ